FGPGAHPRDLRIKLVIPPAGATEPHFDLPGFLAEQEEAGVSWYQAWLQVDPEVRGQMRTYTVRQWRDPDRELVVDLVLHSDEEGPCGPSAQCAESAEVGHRLQLLGPARASQGPVGGIEFPPGEAKQLLLADDETAVPAIASILESPQDDSVHGKAALEGPRAE